VDSLRKNIDKMLVKKHKKDEFLGMHEADAKNNNRKKTLRRKFHDIKLEEFD
jgi:hypothetical protein